MVVLCCITVVTGFLPCPVSRSSFSFPPSQVSYIEYSIRSVSIWSISYMIYDKFSKVVVDFNSIRGPKLFGWMLVFNLF